jgi:hypothetical protein
MKTLMSLFVLATMAAGFSGCAYYEHDRVVPASGYTTDSYYPVRSYDDHWDYYRHYNGIDG